MITRAATQEKFRLLCPAGRSAAAWLELLIKKYMLFKNSCIFSALKKRYL
jgi:hypothetical protein